MKSGHISRFAVCAIALVSAPVEHGIFTKNEIEKWVKVVKASGGRAD